MIRVNVICEGSTEESFVSRILNPYFYTKNIQLIPRNLGSGSSYGKLKSNIIQWLKEDQGAYVTTLFDVYGMGYKYPGYEAYRTLAPLKKASALEQAFKEDIERSSISVYRFIPHFQLHEFEALLFANCAIAEEFLSLDYKFKPGVLQIIKDAFESPEHINDSPQTAPSKRIEAIIPNYQKKLDGILIAEAIGLETIKSECPHFGAWISQLEGLKEL